MNSLEFLALKRHFFNLTEVERAAKIRPTMLHKWVKRGKAKPKVISALDKFFEEIQYKP